MKKYIRSSYFPPEVPYPWGSPEREARVQECADELQKKYPGATIQALRSCIYVISPKIGVDMYVVNDWGHCGILYGGMFEFIPDYLKDGGDIDLVTFTDKLGNVYRPYPNRKSINVTFPNGTSMDLSRNKAEILYRQGHL